MLSRPSRRAPVATPRRLWTVDTIDLDRAKILPVGDGLLHSIQLTPAGQGRIVAVLRISA
jgi:hypothetical protein